MTRFQPLFDDPGPSGQQAYWDHLRETAPCCRMDKGYAIFRLQDVAAILRDPANFSNRVSAHLSIPNGLDGSEHGMWRTRIERCFSAERLNAFAPVAESIADRLILELLGMPRSDVQVVAALPFAAECQCAFMGWPSTVAPVLTDWYHRNITAIRARDRAGVSALADAFFAIVQPLLDSRIDVPSSVDLTADLMHTPVNGMLPTRQELTSILRNWTVGEIGSIAAGIGIILHDLASDQQLQAALRSQPEKIDGTADEILRRRGPLPTARRRTTCPVRVNGMQIPADTPLTLVLTAANRDPRAFHDPDTLNAPANSPGNLLYGAGPHICPGAELARLELRTFLLALFRHTARCRLVPDLPLAQALHPAAGWNQLVLDFT